MRWTQKKKNCSSLLPTDALLVEVNRLWNSYFQFLHHFHPGRRNQILSFRFLYAMTRISWRVAVFFPSSIEKAPLIDWSGVHSEAIDTLKNCISHIHRMNIQINRCWAYSKYQIVRTFRFMACKYESSMCFSKKKISSNCFFPAISSTQELCTLEAVWNLFVELSSIRKKKKDVEHISINRAVYMQRSFSAL